MISLQRLNSDAFAGSVRSKSSDPHAHPTGEWAHLFRNAKRLYQASSESSATPF